MATFVELARDLERQEVRYILIGVWGANFHGPDPSGMFDTEDYDLLLPLEPENLLDAWNACARSGLTVSAAERPLAGLMDTVLAERAVEERWPSRASAPPPGELIVDLSLDIEAFGFESMWAERRIFLVDGVSVSVARLSQIIRSKAATNREQDRQFLATHADTLRLMLDQDED